MENETPKKKTNNKEEIFNVIEIVNALSTKGGTGVFRVRIDERTAISIAIGNTDLEDTITLGTSKDYRSSNSLSKREIKVFVSYSSEDEPLLMHFTKNLKSHLRRKGNLTYSFWTDHKIDVGSKWKVEILKALENCNVVILFISADFITSQFIEEEELAHFLKKQDEKLIIPVLARDYDFSYFEELSSIQFIKIKYRDIGLISHNGNENELLPFEALIEPKIVSKIYMNRYAKKLAALLHNAVENKWGLG